MDVYHCFVSLAEIILMEGRLVGKIQTLIISRTIVHVRFSTLKFSGTEMAFVYFFFVIFIIALVSSLIYLSHVVENLRLYFLAYSTLLASHPFHFMPSLSTFLIAYKHFSSSAFIFGIIFFAYAPWDGASVSTSLFVGIF